MPAPYQPVDLASASAEAFDLSLMAKELKNDDLFLKSGRVARTLARGEQMTAVLTVMKKDCELHEHATPGPATVTVLSGNVEFSFDPPRDHVILHEGCTVVFSKDAAHRVKAQEDSAFLIVIGGRRNG
ncbi:MAG TPA: cupin domain-containing protein [Vicinamibacteria bacterium]|jgi:quercetin dioxygenase-like cupin family protein